MIGTTSVPSAWPAGLTEYSSIVNFSTFPSPSDESLNLLRIAQPYFFFELVFGFFRKFWHDKSHVLIIGPAEATPPFPKVALWRF